MLQGHVYKIKRLITTNIGIANKYQNLTVHSSLVAAEINSNTKKTIKPKDLFKLPHDMDSQKKTPLPSKEEVDRIKNRAVQLPI